MAFLSLASTCTDDDDCVMDNANCNADTGSCVCADNYEGDAYYGCSGMPF